MSSITLTTLPPELLEHIAFFVCTSPLLGPPSALLALLTLNRAIYESLAPDRNPHLYARVFEAKFDLGAMVRRGFGSGGGGGWEIGIANGNGNGVGLREQVSAQALTRLLIHRFTTLSRIRSLTGCKFSGTSSPSPSPSSTSQPHLTPPPTTDTILHTSFTLMLENDHMNRLQLLHARFPDWLMHFWFERDGASLAVEALSVGRWAECDERLAIAMWLFWFFLDPSECHPSPSFVFSVWERVILSSALCVWGFMTFGSTICVISFDLIAKPITNEYL